MKQLRKWIGTSWKMNKSLAEALDFARALSSIEWQENSSIQRFVVPTFTSAREVKTALAESSVLVGAQNMHWENAGAWTGEISPTMLVDCGLDMVELGHSERRTYFGETDQTVALKTAAAVRHGLIPLICVGETLAERDAGRARERVEQQVRTALQFIESRNSKQQILFAYEPVWAIGEAGTPACPDYANLRQSEISSVAEDVLGFQALCLYGGSVTVDNCATLICQPNIDGLFIGRAAWNVKGYIDILDRCYSAMKEQRSGT